MCVCCVCVLVDGGTAGSLEEEKRIYLENLNNWNFYSHRKKNKHFKSDFLKRFYDLSMIFYGNFLTHKNFNVHALLKICNLFRKNYGNCKKLI